MLDTETSKKEKCLQTEENHVCAFTISLRMYHHNIATLYGHNPFEVIESISRILDNLSGQQTIIYIHNLGYDWVFLRKFFFLKFGYPTKQLAVKSHKPISIEFENGLVLRDSLILSAQSLETWSQDMDAEHKKQVGKWDYEKIRTQHEEFTPNELSYIECDTLAGVECLDILAQQLNKHLCEMPYTSTGILREEVRRIGKENKAKQLHKKIALSYEEYKIFEKAFHGGYTHGSRFHRAELLGAGVCYDFASSYPFVMCACKFPMTKFEHIEPKTIDWICNESDDTAFIFKLVLIDVNLKNNIAMPYIQAYKCERLVNPVTDNGRIISATYLEIYLTEMDLLIIKQQYTYSDYYNQCQEVMYSNKDYLPRWYTDLIYSQFTDKCTLKGVKGEELHYKLQKSKLNANYGNLVMSNIKAEIIECYETHGEHMNGEYYVSKEKDEETIYNKFIQSYNNILPYQWGVWVCAISAYNLHQLINCCGNGAGGDSADSVIYYCDTDSCYASSFDLDKIKAYNLKCERMLKKNGYLPVIHNGKKFVLGAAELDGVFDRFIQLHAKCYAKEHDGELQITVSGVPKKSKWKKEAMRDITQFNYGFCFDGNKTGKLQHKYIYVDKIYTDKFGNITGDSIDLTSCSYILGQAKDSFYINERGQICEQQFEEE